MVRIPLARRGQKKASKEEEEEDEDAFPESLQPQQPAAASDSNFAMLVLLYLSSIFDLVSYSSMHRSHGCCFTS